MNRLGFESFELTNFNRRAHELCHDAAQGHLEDPAPIMLVGDPGSGKTHLLNAVATHIRTTTTDCGIVAVSATKFPDEVAELITNPEPIDLAQNAILLVDDFDSFDETIDQLRHVIRIFLENEHPIILASNNPLHTLSEPAEELLAELPDLRVIEIAPRTMPATQANHNTTGRHNPDEVIAWQSREIEELRARLNTVYVGHRPHDELEVLRETTQALTEELASARQRLQEAETELGLLRDGGPPLNEARHDADRVREEAGTMLKRAEHLMHEMQENRATFLEAQEEKHSQIAEIAKLESVFADREDADDKALIPEAEPAVESTDDPRLQDAYDEIEELREELERMKQDAAARFEAERTRTERLERELEDSRVSFFKHVESQRAAAEELTSLQSQLSEGSGALERLMGLFGERSANPAEEASEAKQPDEAPRAETIHHADFNAPEESVPHQPGALHHVEELQADRDAYSESPDSDDDGELPEDIQRYA